MQMRIETTSVGRTGIVAGLLTTRTLSLESIISMGAAVTVNEYVSINNKEEE